MYVRLHNFSRVDARSVLVSLAYQQLSNSVYNPPPSYSPPDTSYRPIYLQTKKYIRS